MRDYALKMACLDCLATYDATLVNAVQVDGDTLEGYATSGSTFCHECESTNVECFARIEVTP